MSTARVAGIALAVAGCAAPDLPDTTARFDPAGRFFDTPFPSDARRTPEGGLDWARFPNPSALVLLDTFLAQASARPGAGHNGPVYVHFDRPIDPAALPVPADSTSFRSPIQLIDVTPTSPDFLRAVPIRTEWLPDTGAYLPGNLLAIAPVPGFPLRPRTTYMLLVTTALARPDTRFLDALDATDADPWATALDTVEAALPDLGVGVDDLAIATTFTTADPLAEMDRMVRALRERVDLPPLSEAVELVEDEGGYRVFRSDYATPLWMTGDKPYGQSGGAFSFRDDGLPEIVAWEPMRASVVVPPPDTLAAGPPDGSAAWPLLVYLHGTGGDWRTFCNSTSPFEVGFWGVTDGFIGLGIDLPLHGPRGTSNTIIDLHSFNVLQPESALHIHRQGALDLVALVESLRAAPPTFRLPDGATVPVDPDRIVFVGHSQGGLAGALAQPWLGDRVRASVLSGAGGLLAITAIERDGDYDFPTLIQSGLAFAEGEALTELHPILALVQHLVEPTDPINYARGWFAEDVGALAPGVRPAPVLLTSGLQDGATPSRTAEALAAAAGIPFAGPRHSAAPGHVLRGMDSTALPLSEHVVDFTGAPGTFGFAQYVEGDHFALFSLPETRDLVRTFLRTAIDGAPVLDDSALPDPVAP